MKKIRSKRSYIRPFSNGTESMQWKSNNCDRCCRYENESSKPEDAGCEMAYYLDLGEVTGEIPKRMAIRIGCQYFDGFARNICVLQSQCNHFNKPVKIKAAPTEPIDKRQLKIEFA